MDWVIVVWSMLASAALTLAVVHLWVWIARPASVMYLLSTTIAISIVFIAFAELLLMHAQTVERYASVVRWAHVPVFVLTVSLVCFARLYLNAGRWWLLYSVIAVRVAILVASFLSPISVNYAAITDLRKITLWGGREVTFAEFTASPMNFFALTGTLMVAAFVADAAVTVWRRGERRKATVVPVAIVLFVTFASVHGTLIHLGFVQSPYMISAWYLAIVFAMTRELSYDIVQSARTAERLLEYQKELAESEGRVELAARAAGLGFWSLDPVSNALWLSSQGRVMFGLDPAGDLRFERVYAAIHPDDRRHVRDAIRQAVADCTDFDAEFRVVTQPDAPQWIAIRGRMECPPGGPNRLRGVFIDVNARKRVELEAAQGHVQIAHLSRVTMLGELSGAIAHELNQPLTSILSNAETAQILLDRDPIDSECLRTILSEIVEQDIRAGEIIRRLRGLLKRGEVHLQPLDINSVVSEVMALVRNDLINRGVLVQMDLGPGLPPVLGDRVQLQQVLLNLVVNACDAMLDVPAADRILALRTGKSEGGGVSVCVIDRGGGIPADQLEKVFEPFITTKQAGMGMGLAVSKTIVETHGGRIWASRDGGGGARLCLTLPATGGSGS